MTKTTPPKSQSDWRSPLITAALALVFGFLGAAIWSLSGLADTRTRSYLRENPEVLNEMVAELEAREQAQRLANVGGEVFKPFPGAVLGNPSGSKTLVEFTDYNCPYCEASLEDVAKLVESDPEVRVVVREFPIFEGSDVASRMALAAALQGKYEAFHKRMFEMGPATPETVDAAARAAGLDMAIAKKDAASPRVAIELARNRAMANMIGFGGTPAWVTGDRAKEGAIGFDGLRQLLEEAGPAAES